MRKILFFLVLFFSAFSYGQLKQTKLTDEEVNVLATKTSQGFGEFNYNELRNISWKIFLLILWNFNMKVKLLQQP